MPDPLPVDAALGATRLRSGARGREVRARIACVALTVPAVLAIGCGAPKTAADSTAASATATPTPPASASTTRATSSDTSGAMSAASADVTPSNAGFAGPENLVYDSVSDVYLVSNMNGGPIARDGNGFVTRLDSAGHVIAQKWIDGTKGATRLDGPKGLAIHGDTLAIADVGVVRLFNRRTGASLGVWQTPGLLLNDVSYAPDGTLWVTDTQGPDSAGAIYHFDRKGHATRVAHGKDLDGPDGIVALTNGGVMYATFGADRVARVAPNGTATRVVTLPGKKVDGLRRLADGSYVVSSWDAHTVYRLTGDSTLHPLLTGVTSPAGLAIDAHRNRLAVTSMNDNRLYFVPLH